MQCSFAVTSETKISLPRPRPRLELSQSPQSQSQYRDRLQDLNYMSFNFEIKFQTKDMVETRYEAESLAILWPNIKDITFKQPCQTILDKYSRYFQTTMIVSLRELSWTIINKLKFKQSQTLSTQCNTNRFKYSNIRIISTEYYIFEYEYSIFLFRIYSIFVFGKIGRNKYIRYSYSVKSFHKCILICIP